MRKTNGRRKTEDRRKLSQSDFDLHDLHDLHDSHDLHDLHDLHDSYDFCLTPYFKAQLLFPPGNDPIL